MGGPGSGPRKGGGKGKSFNTSYGTAGGRTYGSKPKKAKAKLSDNQKSQKKNDAKLRKEAKERKMFPGRG